MSGRAFDAFALPRGIPAEELALVTLDDRPVRVRYVDVGIDWIVEVTAALRTAGDTLATRSAEDLARVLGGVGARFADPDDALRTEALALLAPTAGLSPEMAAVVLDGMAADWTEARLRGLLRAELADGRVLDGFLAIESPTAPRAGDGADAPTDVPGELPAGPPAVLAVGPGLCVQILAGSVPGVSVTALIRSLLVKGPTLVKPGRGDVTLPVLFARALREADPDLADALAVVYWPGGQHDVEGAALREADVVTAYGSDETVAALRARTPVTTRFVPYHHRVSVGMVGRDALAAGDSQEHAAAEVAEAVALFDQRGCVSPQTVFVEGGDATVAEFAGALARALVRLEDRLPSGPLDAEEASSLHQARGTMEMMEATGEAAVLHGGAAPWTVIVESGAGSVGACAGRTIRLRAVSDLAEVPRLVEPLGPHLQTAGVAGVGERSEALATALGRVGVSRVVPFRSVAFPPPWWHHDGRGPLRDLVRWVDLERE